MIEVDRLSRQYHAIKAVDRISFAVGRGEIVGLLGPNGAGKTTTMRMLTTFLTPTSGRAVLAGHDVLDEPLGVRQHVGYLPENVPLYPEMRVREYIAYRARLKDVPRSKRKSSIDRVLSRCQLLDVDTRVLGHLSKGYRQRVGLADAMVHDPEILVLDEPTAGLDPIQIREVRALIRELGSEHTILISTHIMSEVEAVCSRVLMIVKGRVALDDQLENLQQRDTIVLDVRGPFSAVAREVEAVPGVRQVMSVKAVGDLASLEVVFEGGSEVSEAIAQRVVQNGWGLRRLDLRRSSLEDEFVKAVNASSLDSSRRSAEGTAPSEIEAA